MLGILDEAYSNEEMSLEEITLFNKPLRIYREITVSAHDNPPENNLIEVIKKTLEEHMNTYNYTKSIYVLYITETKLNMRVAALIKDKKTGKGTVYSEFDLIEKKSSCDVKLLVKILFDMVTVAVERR